MEVYVEMQDIYTQLDKSIRELLRRNDYFVNGASKECLLEKLERRKQRLEVKELTSNQPSTLCYDFNLVDIASDKEVDTMFCCIKINIHW